MESFLHSVLNQYVDQEEAEAEAEAAAPPSSSSSPHPAPSSSSTWSWGGDLPGNRRGRRHAEAEASPLSTGQSASSSSSSSSSSSTTTSANNARQERRQQQQRQRGRGWLPPWMRGGAGEGGGRGQGRAAPAAEGTPGAEARTGRREGDDENEAEGRGRGGFSLESYLETLASTSASASASASAAAGGNVDPTQHREIPAPPASRRAIRKLPTVVVTPEDLVDENNRECCICLEDNCLRDRVIRLPCAHIFHRHCIIDWLTKRCTCPICRYELPTDNPAYEPYRRERMRQRKPRFAQYELRRMSAKELLDLSRRIGMWAGNEASMGSKKGGGKAMDARSMCMEKDELIRSIVDSGKVEIISAPEPVEYGSVRELKEMGVGKLRRAMESAGVFFDPTDVVEKNDMVEIFVRSGRVVFREGEDEIKDKDEDGIAGGYGDSKLNAGDDDGACRKLARSGSSDRKESEGESGGGGGGGIGNDGDPPGVNEGDGAEGGGGGRGERSSSRAGGDRGENGAADEAVGVAAANNRNDDDGGNAHQHDEDGNINERENGRRARAEGGTTAAAAGAAAFASRTVSDLKALGRELRVDLSDCIEKKDMVEKIAARVAANRGGGGGGRMY